MRTRGQAGGAGPSGQGDFAEFEMQGLNLHLKAPRDGLLIQEFVHTKAAKKAADMEKDLEDQLEAMEGLGVLLCKNGTEAQVSGFAASCRAVRMALATARAHGRTLRRVAEPARDAERVDELDEVLGGTAADLAAAQEAERALADEYENFLYVARHPQCGRDDLPHPDAAGTAAPAEDDEVEVEWRNPFLPLNVRCPITGLPIAEIREPVEDLVGYVYERAEIAKEVRKAGGRLKCPIAGSGHVIREGDLRPSRKAARVALCARNGIDLAAAAQDEEDAIEL